MRLALEKGDVDLVYKSLNPSDIADLAKNPEDRHQQAARSLHPLPLLRDFRERVQG